MMKNVFFLLSFSLSFMLISCDPCKDTFCDQGVCDDGYCLCDVGYEGVDCSIEERAKFEGVWKGSYTCNASQPTETTIQISPLATINEVNVNFTSGSESIIFGSNIGRVEGTLCKTNQKSVNEPILGLKFDYHLELVSVSETTIKATLFTVKEGVSNNCTFEITKQ